MSDEKERVILARPNPGALCRDQLQASSQLLGRAFANDPTLVRADPDCARRVRWLPCLYRAAMRYALATGGVELVGGHAAALWLQRQTEPSFWRALGCGMLRIPLAMGMRAWLRLARHEAWCADRVRAVCAPNYGYLWILGVDPTAQRAGYGSLAVGAAAAAMRAQGHGVCILKTETESNVTFYRQLGFECIDDRVVPSSQIRYWLLRQELPTTAQLARSGLGPDRGARPA
ncbi:MAG TPA: GNAT family N-acetyltransferase [Polyangiaceae bacterium]|nr:GNAT family N-acetyltransferase [Polyangiaceae bacterium]